MSCVRAYLAVGLGRVGVCRVGFLGSPHKLGRVVSRMSDRPRHQIRTARVSSGGAGLRRIGGFSLIDMLVSIVVIAIMIGILLPSLAGVNETARRVVCRSGLLQIGIGLGMYTDAYRDELPPSVYWSRRSGRSSEPQLQEMLRLRLERSGGQADSELSLAQGTWDGLGWLHHDGSINGPKVFYCPSHRGEHKFSRYADLFAEDPAAEIFANYQYRGAGPNRQRKLALINPARSAITSDGFRSSEDLNHEGGMNVLRADLSVAWASDRTGEINQLIAEDGGPGGGANPIGSGTADQIWKRIDANLFEVPNQAGDGTQHR